jgi:mRNA-degrading endonuclease RelE of RelBE toxin-antitoxin system
MPTPLQSANKKSTQLQAVDTLINNRHYVCMAHVTLTPGAAEQLEALNSPLHGRVLRLLVRLEQWPDVSGAKRLMGELAGSYRLRTGDYRVQFSVVGDKVTVDKIGHRDGFYGE